MKTKKTVCFVAGKSAGHILPAITLAQQLKSQNQTLQIVFISNHTALDYQAVASNPNIDKHLAINLMALPYQKFWLLPKFTWQLIRAFLQTYQIFKTNRPSQVISTGGLIAIPVCLVARALKIPITIYELNVTPGKATKFLAKFASELKICFKKTAALLPGIKCTLSAYPSRFSQLDYNLSKLAALNLVQTKNPDFTASKQTILILGGSQGSVFINQTIAKFIEQLATQPSNLNLQIIHQTGHNDQTNWPEFYFKHQIPAIVFSYESALMPYYQLADLIICRSGAGTLAEIVPLKTSCITIPLQTDYTSHQLENALELAQEHHWIKVLQQNEISADFNVFSKHVRFPVPKS